MIRVGFDITDRGCEVSTFGSNYQVIIFVCSATRSTFPDISKWTQRKRIVGRLHPPHKLEMSLKGRVA